MWRGGQGRTSWSKRDAQAPRRPGSANAALKVPALGAGIVAGTDCIDDMDLLRRGLPIAFTGIWAPSTWGRSSKRGPVRSVFGDRRGLLGTGIIRGVLNEAAPVLPCRT